MFTNFRTRIIRYLTNKEAWISNLKTLAVVAVVYGGISYYQQRNMTKGIAPLLKVSEETVIETEINKLPDLTKINYNNKPTLVYFWGTWCPICKTTSSSISTLAEENNYQIISVALSSGSNEDIKAYQKEQGYNFNTINDDNGQISKEWGVTVTPSFFYVDTKGEITAISTGIASIWGMRFRLWTSN